MSLKSDIDEVAHLWKAARWHTRLLLALGVFFSISSIASLADVIFQWKGFIQQGIVFYQDWIRQPIASLFDWFKIPIDPDITIASSIAFSICFKSDFHDTAYKDKGWLHFLIKLFLALTLFILAISLLFQFAPALASFGASVFVLIALGFTFELSRRERVAYFMYVGLIFLSLCVLGAINSGITRTA